MRSAGERERRKRRPVVVGRVLVRELLHRAVAGRRRVSNRVVGLTRLGGRDEVVRQLAEVWRRVGGVQVLERAAHSPVQAQAPRPAERVVGGLAHERVREREATGRVGLVGDQIGREGVLERAEQLLLVELREPLQHVESEASPDDGRNRQDVVGVLAQPGQAPPDHVLDALGNAHRARVSRTPSSAPATRTRPGA